MDIYHVVNLDKGSTIVSSSYLKFNYLLVNMNIYDRIHFTIKKIS